ncbi:hypothetical protein CYMTET_28499 [Cymbomonas tetramitiformis]|uniref:Uncharacterized protein n=1 Tax=Cymbomonas tetramitiformis TaxID=36881 RepID=A0AAE0KW41_9CHLO|nr:hypothetical protein CYMTET_28499 [Cymbomonas tetramitiformis]
MQQYNRNGQQQPNQPPPPPYPPPALNQFHQPPPPASHFQAQSPQAWAPQDGQFAGTGGGFKPGIAQQLRDRLHQSEMQRMSADLELKHERSTRAALDKQRPDAPRRTSSKSRETPTRTKSTSVSKSKSRSRTSKRDKLTDWEPSSGSGDSADEALSPETETYKRRRQKQKRAKQELDGIKRKLDEDAEATRSLLTAQLQAQLQAAQVEIATLRTAATAAVAAATGSKNATARKRVFREGARGGRGRARTGGRGRGAAPVVEDLVDGEEAEDEVEEDRSWVYPVTTTPADVNEKFKGVPGIKRLEDVLRALNELPAGWDDNKPRGGVERRTIVNHVVDLHDAPGSLDFFKF